MKVKKEFFTSSMQDRGDGIPPPGEHLPATKEDVEKITEFLEQNKIPRENIISMTYIEPANDWQHQGTWLFYWEDK